MSRILCETLKQYYYKTMNKLIEEIIKEKDRAYPDTYYIQRLQRLMDKKRVELDDFISTARNISREDFEREYFMVKLQKECTYVINMLLDLKIQVLGEAPHEAYHFEGLFDGINISITNKDFNAVAQQVYNLFVDDVVNVWKKDY